MSVNHIPLSEPYRERSGFWRRVDLYVSVSVSKGCFASFFRVTECVRSVLRLSSMDMTMFRVIGSQVTRASEHSGAHHTLTHTHTHTHTHRTHTHTHTHTPHTHTHTHTHTLHSLQNDISTCKAPDNLRPITRKRQEHDRNKNTFTSVYCLISISALYTRTIYFYITPHTRHLDANFIFYILHLIYVVR